MAVPEGATRPNGKSVSQLLPTPVSARSDMESSIHACLHDVYHTSYLRILLLKSPAKQGQPTRERTGGNRRGEWRYSDGAPATTERRTEKTAEDSGQDAPGQRGQPGPGAGPGGGESEEDVGSPAPGRLGNLGGAGHDRKTQAAPLVPDPPGRGPAVRHRPPASRHPGRRREPPGSPPSTPRGNCPRTTGSGSPWTTTTRSTWRSGATPPSPPVIRMKQTETAPITSTRPGPPPRAESRHPCGVWPCWSRSTGWPPT